MLYTDYMTRLPEHSLMLTDRVSMAHGVEIRSPLVDKELVEFMATYPLRLKIRGLETKYAERRLAERLLPVEIARRKKRGFRFAVSCRAYGTYEKKRADSRGFEVLEFWGPGGVCAAGSGILGASEIRGWR